MEARTDVLDELVVWVLVLEVLDLPLQVFFLVGATDSGVDNSTFVLLRGFFDSKVGPDGVNIVQSPPTSTGSNSCNFSIFNPIAQC
jgi:hypothetical protein